MNQRIKGGPKRASILVRRLARDFIQSCTTPTIASKARTRPTPVAQKWTLRRRSGLGRPFDLNCYLRFPPKSGLPREPRLIRQPAQPYSRSWRTTKRCWA